MQAGEQPIASTQNRFARAHQTQKTRRFHAIGPLGQAACDKRSRRGGGGKHVLCNSARFELRGHRADIELPARRREPREAAMAKFEIGAGPRLSRRTLLIGGVALSASGTLAAAAQAATPKVSQACVGFSDSPTQRPQMRQLPAVSLAVVLPRRRRRHQRQLQLQDLVAADRVTRRGGGSRFTARWRL